MDKMLYQVQRLVANLECSEKSVFDMAQFCHSFKTLDKDYNKGPISNTQQKDSQEFLLEFFEKMEKKLRETTR